jgi:hypothetical protein
LKPQERGVAVGRRYFMKAWVATVLSGAGCVSCWAAEPADLLLVHGKVVTVDDGFSIRSAVAVKGGRILAVGAVWRPFSRWSIDPVAVGRCRCGESRGGEFELRQARSNALAFFL